MAEALQVRLDHLSDAASKLRQVRKNLESYGEPFMAFAKPQIEEIIGHLNSTIAIEEVEKKK